MESTTAQLDRIAVLPAALADQIAAGEVVERPGSIVKELVDNAIDAGARRVELELEGGGSTRIRIIDDGRGIQPDDLALALTRHATSKLHRPEQLVEIVTLGFRGEALASIAAVARVDLRSRVRGAAVGQRLRSSPGELGQIEPIGMPEGTQVEIEHLFANVPARRKFLRSEATEVGHCVEAVVRAALVHPRVHFRVRHGGRELLDLPAADEPGRVIAVLRRRGGGGETFHQFAGERQGVRVSGWFAPPAAATRQRQASFVVVRRRVVRERTLAAVLKQAYGDALPRGVHPVACLFVEPPRGTVDVNVHPQKSEVRFAAAQSVYAAVRALVDEGLTGASWRRASGVHQPDDGGPSPWPERADQRQREGARAALAGWSRRDALGAGVIARDRAGGGQGGGSGQGSGASYQLGTRAAERDYSASKQAFRGEVDQLRARLASEARGRGGAAFEGHADARLPFAAGALDADEGLDADRAREADNAHAGQGLAPDPGPRLLTCLPGPVAVFEFGGELLVADLRQVRADLVRRRLLVEWAASGDGRAPGQRLLQPVVLRRRPAERERLLAYADELAGLGLELEGFGDDAVLVRAVPAALPDVLDATEVGLLLHRLLPYLALRERASHPPADAREGLAHALAAIAGARSVDTSPRLARRWIAELLELHQGSIDAVPGIRLWSAAALVGAEPVAPARADPETQA